MNLKNIIVLLVLMLAMTSTKVFCQTIPYTLKELSNKFAADLLKSKYPKSKGYTHSNDNTLHHPDHEFTLGHISVEIKEEYKGDFNEDGNVDYWGSIHDEGMGGGGNMFAYEL